VLTQRLAHGEPSQEDIAELLGMSARTLQRKLGESGTTYKEILDDTRYALALAYLSVPRHSVSDSLILLGFSAGSCFTRAFRRWTGHFTLRLARGVRDVALAETIARREAPEPTARQLKVPATFPIHGERNEFRSHFLHKNLSRPCGGSAAMIDLGGRPPPGRTGTAMPLTSFLPLTEGATYAELRGCRAWLGRRRVDSSQRSSRPTRALAP